MKCKRCQIIARDGPDLIIERDAMRAVVDAAIAWDAKASGKVRSFGGYMKECDELMVAVDAYLEKVKP